MTIETKYQIGDHHWDIDGKIVKAKRVIEIRINVKDWMDSPPTTTITYVVEGNYLVPEDSFTPSKQELLNSL